MSEINIHRGGGGGGGAGDGYNIIAAGTQTANTTGTIVFSNSNGLSFGMSNSSVITGSYTVPTQTVQPAIQSISAGTTRITTGEAVFSNSNGLSFGVNGGTITASYTVPSTAGLLSAIKISAGTTSNNLSAITFNDANGISFGLNASTVTASHNGLTSQSNQNVTAGNGGFAFQTLSFSNVNGVSFGTSAGPAITASHNGLTSQSNQAFSAAGGTSAFQTLGFSDNSNVSWTNTNGSVGVASVRASLFAVNNTTQSSSGTQNINAISFAGAGIASVGVSNGSVVVSVPAGGGAGDGGVFAGVSDLGNTAGSTGTVSTGNFVLVGAGQVSLSQSTGAAGSAATVTINVPNEYTYSGFNLYADIELVTIATSQATLSIEPFKVPNVQFDRIAFLVNNTNSSNSSGSHTLSFRFGIYTQNGSTLSLLTSQSTSTAVTHSGTAGSYSLYSGLRMITMGLTTTLSEGKYWVAFNSNTTSGGANGSYSLLGISQIASNFMGHFGSSHNTTYQYTLGQGLYTASTTGIPGSIGFSQIRGSDSQALRSPAVLLVSSTI